MKKITILFLLMVLGIISSYAQTILRYTPSTGAGHVYTNLDTAYAEAQNDDVLYLSGHTFLMSSHAYIEKRLQWVGAGVHADSTSATGETRINPRDPGSNYFIIRPAAGNSSFTGINFGGFRLYDCDVTGNISLVTFSRCKFISDWISLSYTGNFTGSTLNYRFQECIFNTFVGGNGFQSGTVSNITFDNCLFAHSVFRLRTGVYNFNNCIFWASATDDGIAQNSGCSFRGCIFWNAAATNLFSGGYMEQNNLFDRCAFSHATIPVGGAGVTPTIVTNCIANVSQLFANTNGNFTYEDADDYHLVSGSAALTAGTGGGQCGIYGGSTPAKNGAVPYNPHISSKTIAPATINGQLNINFVTTAQNY